MKSNKKSFGNFSWRVGSDGEHRLCWVKKKVGKRYKIMYVERYHNYNPWGMEPKEVLK